MSKYQEVPCSLRIPSIGLGTGGFPDVDTLEQSVECALEAGYRHIDTAYSYKNSEETIGKVLKRWISLGRVKREDLFIVTKLPREGVDPSKVDFYMNESLKRLQLDYVDLYLIHHPILIGPGKISKTGETIPGDPLPTDIIGTWKKMEEQVDAGRARFIGLSNFDRRQIERIWQIARIKPSCLQIKITVFLQGHKIVKYCQEKGIIVVGYTMLAAPKVEIPGISTNIFTNETITRIAQKYTKSNAQIVLRFFLEKNIVGIPKTTNLERIKANINIFDFSLDSEDKKALEDLHIGEIARGKSTADSNPTFTQHPEYPKFDD